MDEEKENYIIGDLLWAKIGNHPFWPCMVSYDPMKGCYYSTKKTKKGEVRIYHVQYFGKQVQHGWTSPGLILPFEGETKFHLYRINLMDNATSAIIRKKINTKYNISPPVYDSWLVAVQEAEVAMSIKNPDRFETFVFKYETNWKKSKATGGKPRRRIRKTKPTKSVKKAREASEIDEALCKICEIGEIDLTCAGNCLQSFHKKCLGLICTPKNFECCNCDRGMLTCFACKRAGTSLIKCNKCDYHYHDECMKKFSCANHEKQICSAHVCLTCHNEHPRNISSKGPFVRCFRCPTIFHATDHCIPVGSVRLTPSLIDCPDHFIGKKQESLQPTCNVPYCLRCSEGGELVCCEACPACYHKNCIEEDVPDGDFICEDCLKRRFLYVGMVVWTKTGQFRWWPAQIISPKDLPLNIKKLDRTDGEFPVRYFGTDEYYWTHRGRVIPYREDHKDFNNTSSSKSCKLSVQYKLSLQEAAEAYDEYITVRKNHIPNEKPDTYKHIRVNHVVPPASIYAPHAKTVLRCVCNPDKPNPCDTNICLNRSVAMECHPDLCLAGDLCKNQRFQRRQYAEVKVIKTQNRGWGLITLEFIPKETFVIEYVGEIITHEEYRKRCIKMQEDNIQNYYFLYIDARRMIDAGPKGNLARFMNHSCSPNCEMQKWSVNGDLRVGIFSLADILPGEELTFNYHSDNIQFEQRCYCGSERCQGFIGRRGDKPNAKRQKAK